MPQSLASVAVHFVFSTKAREPWIRDEWAERLRGYIGGVLHSGGCRLLVAGGVEDHIHLLVSLGRTASLADLMRMVKTNSSAWVHDAFREYPFAWQNGYGVFGVSHSDIPAVHSYIERQKEHHATESYQDEYRRLLTAHGLEWDERFVWD